MADSVGVKTPVRMPPTMMTGVRLAKMERLKVTHTWRQLKPPRWVRPYFRFLAMR